MTVDYFVEIGKTQNPQTSEEFTVRYHQLVATGKKNEADQLRSDWRKRSITVSLSAPKGTVWEEIAQPEVELSLLPACSWFLSFKFRLAKPYLSKDDNPFYIIDNPIARDKVFRLPMVRPTSWKGNLYSALWQLGYDKKNDETMRRLFGDVSSEESGQAGRLFFYPTFFTQTGIEIINPHDRKRRVGKNPILFECVPQGAQGTFSLLYVPFDLVGKDETETCRQAAADLLLVSEGLQAMFLTYGFSAKRTSGYGVAEEKVSGGFFQIRIEETVLSSPSALPPAHPQLPKYLQAPGKLKDEYLTPEGTFRERTQAELAKMSKAQRQEYEKAQKWWEREGKDLREQPPAPTELPPAPAPQWLRREFDSFQQLCEQANQVAQMLQTGGDA
jgi:CRISPR-associated protein Cmr2